jgi:hypothetical protein
MKQFHFIVLFLVVAFESNAQTTVVWGDEFKTEKRISIAALLSDQNYFYVVKRNTSTKGDPAPYFVEQFDATSMKLLRKMDIRYPKFDGSPDVAFSDLLSIDGKLWLFMEGWKKMGRNGRLYAAPLDIAEGTIGKGILIDSFAVQLPKMDFRIQESRNGKNILVMHNDAVDSKYKSEKFYYKVYDGNMQLVWKKEIEMPFRDRTFKITHHLLDQKGNVHLVSAVNQEREKGDQRDHSVANNKYHLISYYHEQNLVKEFEISLGEKWISALTFDLAPDGQLVLAGFYSNAANYSISGTFYLRIDPDTRSVVQSNLKSFEKNFLLEFLPERKVKKGMELSDFYFDHLIVREDGSALLIAEQYYMQVVYTYNDPYMNGMYGWGNPYAWGGNSPYYRSNYNYQYHYNDLIVVSVDADGNIDWTRKIPKRQMSANDGGFYSSYALASNEKHAYILFNDNPRNTPDYRKRSDDPYAMTKPSKSQAMLVTIDRDGKFVYSSLFAQKDLGLILRPKLCYQYSPDRLILYSQKNSRYKFGSVTLP